MKICAACHKEKPESEYYHHPTMADRLNSKCKECYNAAARASRRARIERHPELVRAAPAQRVKAREHKKAAREREFGSALESRGPSGDDPNTATRDAETSNRAKILPVSKGMVRCPTCEGRGQVAAEAVSIGMRVMMARKAAGMTQAELAPKLKIGRGQLAHIESDRGLPSVAVLVRIANVLGVSTDHLLGRAS